MVYCNNEEELAIHPIAVSYMCVSSQVIYNLHSLSSP